MNEREVGEPVKWTRKLMYRGITLAIAWVVLGQMICPRSTLAQARRMLEIPPTDSVDTVLPIEITADPITIVLGIYDGASWAAGSTTWVHVDPKGYPGAFSLSVTGPAGVLTDYALFCPAIKATPFVRQPLYVPYAGAVGPFTALLELSVPGDTEQRPSVGLKGMYGPTGSPIFEADVPLDLTVQSEQVPGITPGGHNDSDPDATGDRNGPFRRVISGFGSNTYTGMCADLTLPPTDLGHCNVVNDVLRSDCIDVYSGGNCGYHTGQNGTITGDNALDVGLQMGHVGNPGWKPMCHYSGFDGAPADHSYPYGQYLPSGQVHFELYAPGCYKEAIEDGKVKQVMRGANQTQDTWALWPVPGWTQGVGKSFKRLTSIAQANVNRAQALDLPRNTPGDHAYASGSWVRNVVWGNCLLYTDKDPSVIWDYSHVHGTQIALPGPPYVTWTPAWTTSEHYSNTETVVYLSTLPSMYQ